MSDVRDGDFKPNENRTFLELWDHLSSLDATDPRDKVFALLGLVPDDPLKIIPDYSKSAEEVFSTVVRTACNISTAKSRGSMLGSHISEILFLTSKYYPTDLGS